MFELRHHGQLAAGGSNVRLRERESNTASGAGSGGYERTARTPLSSSASGWHDSGKLPVEGEGSSVKTMKEFGLGVPLEVQQVRIGFRALNAAVKRSPLQTACHIGNSMCDACCQHRFLMSSTVLQDPTRAAAASGERPDATSVVAAAA